FHPPEAAAFFATLARIDPTLTLAARVMLVISVMVPLVFMALAWAAFGKSAAKGTLIFASLYPPFIAYSGFFFIEGPMSLLLGLSLSLYLWATRMKSLRVAFVMAIAAGVFLSVATGFRLVAVPAVLLFALVFTLFFRGPLDPPAIADEGEPDAQAG